MGSAIMSLASFNRRFVEIIILARSGTVVIFLFRFKIYI